MSDNPHYLDEPRDDRGRWTAGGSGPARADGSTASAPGGSVPQDTAKGPWPDAAVRMSYAIHGAVPRFAPGIRNRISQYLDRGGTADLGAVLTAYARGRSMSDKDFRTAFGLGPSVTGPVLADLRRAAAGIQAARTIEAMGAASDALANALTAIGPSRLGLVIGGARAGAAKLDQANLETMAGVLQAEAGSVTDRVAMEAIGHTILNRMQRNGTARVEDVVGNGQYAKPLLPRDETTALARKLLDGTSPDLTGGATHFYSPQTMSKEGGIVHGDVSGGLETVPGVVGKDKRAPARNYKPNWAATYTYVQPPGIPPAIAKFYIQPGNGPVGSGNRHAH